MDLVLITFGGIDCLSLKVLIGVVVKLSLFCCQCLDHNTLVVRDAVMWGFWRLWSVATLLTVTWRSDLEQVRYEEVIDVLIVQDRERKGDASEEHGEDTTNVRQTVQ